MTICSEPDRSLISNNVRLCLFITFQVFYSFKPKENIGKRQVNLSNPLNFVKPKRIISLNGKNKKIEVEPIRASETIRYKGSTILIDQVNFAHLSWSRAMRAIATHEQAWVKYCYGASNDFNMQIIICQHIWCEFLKEKELRSIKIKKPALTILKSLVWLAVQFSKEKIQTERNLYIQKELAALAGKSKQAWNQNFKSHWQILTGLCFQLDKEALSHVDRHHHR